MIQIKDVHFSFGEEIIFSGINLNIEEKEAVVILGPSGQGKSTLLKLIAGLLKPQKGIVQLASNHHATSMLFQKNALFDSMTNLENVSFPMMEQNNSLNISDAENKAKEYLSAVGLSHAIKLYPDEISGGMQKRLGIARALAIEPKVLLYDDPTAGLDPITSKEIAKLIRNKQKEGEATIISVTNDMKRAYQLGEKFIFLYQGKLEIFSSKKDLEEAKNPVVYQFIRGLTEGPLNA